MAYFHCLIGGGSSGGGYELTVTCDADFAGTTITCTDGVTTLTKTCPSASPYEVVFEIPNGGDWTISGVVSGQTVTTGVNIPTTAELIAFVHKTITIYSAKEDTVTYTDIYGDTQTEVFASGESSKQITIDIEPNGSSITFTSGVAKNPSDLTAYYSKTVTITSNTTDVYLMPENTLYWWGYFDSNCEQCTSANGWGGNVDAPTINTNSVTLNPSSNRVKGIGTKTSISPTKLYNISKITSGGASVQMGVNTSKNVTLSQIISNSSSSIALAQGTVTSGTYYVTVKCENNQSGEVYAFWYE